MTNSEARAWQAAYVSAVLETDPEKVPPRIVEAQLAIERRLLESPSPDALEHQGIKAAWNALAALQNVHRSRVATIEAMPNRAIHQSDHSPGQVLVKHQ